MKHKSLGVFGLILGLSLLWPASAFSGCMHEDLTTDENFAARAPARLVHGVSNVLSSPVQLFTQPKDTVQCEKDDLLVGIGSGIIGAGKYLIYGVWDIATFWVPGKAGRDLAVTDCGWAQAVRHCPEKPKSSGTSEK